MQFQLRGDSVSIVIDEDAMYILFPLGETAAMLSDGSPSSLPH